MNRNALIINGHQYWEMSPGKLNKLLVDVAEQRLERSGYTVKTTRIDGGFEVADEVEKML